MANQSSLLLIGVSPRIYYPVAPVLDLGGVWNKTLHYLEQSVAQLLMHCGALPVMIPAIEAKGRMQRGEINVAQYAQELDGLVLQGGNDVAPESYGQTPINDDCKGDVIRDEYEIGLIRAFVDAGKPVLGICRGLQVLNVAFGGTLWQDIEIQLPQALNHIDKTLYEHNTHSIKIAEGSRLAQLYPKSHKTLINSIHHQAIRTLAPEFTIEATCPEDGVIEAVRHQSETLHITGVQWHPEFTSEHPDHFDSFPILDDYLQAVRKRKLSAT